MAFNKLGTLYKHTTRTTTRVINSALVWLQYLYQRADNTGRCVKLTTQTALIQLRTGEILRQNTFQAIVFTLYSLQCRIYHLAYFGFMCSSTNLAPSGFSRHEEDILGSVFVLVFRVGIFFAL